MSTRSTLSHLWSHLQGFTLFFGHRQVRSVQALAVVMETEAGLEAGYISGHSEEDSCETNRHRTDSDWPKDRSENTGTFTQVLSMLDVCGTVFHWCCSRVLPMLYLFCTSVFVTYDVAVFYPWFICSQYLFRSNNLLFTH